MLLRILSDLHIEGFPFKYTYCGEDAILLAGDIHTRNRLHLFLETLPRDVPVFYVPGNHCYYHVLFEEANAYFKSLESEFNFHFLYNEQKMCGDIPIYGGTMFTDWELNGVGEKWFAKHGAKDLISDFEVMAKAGVHFEMARWSVEDHAAEFEKFLGGLKVFLKATEGAPQRIVMSHFMPSHRCIAPQFKGSNLNPYFTADMEPYMGWKGLWVAGHGHNVADFMSGDTRVVMNPLGYRSKYGVENPFFKHDLLIEI